MVEQLHKKFLDEEVNPVRELCSLTTKDDGIEPPSLRNDLYHRQESVAFSNGVKSLFESYLSKEIEIDYVLQILGIKRNRFLNYLALSNLIDLNQ